MEGWQILLGIVVVGIVFLADFGNAPFRSKTAIHFAPANFYRKQVVGLENVPKDQGCVIVANHVSWLDGVLLLWMLPRNIRFVVDGGNFNNPIFKFLASTFGTILMSASPKSIGRALKTGREGIEAGDMIGIFPEGTLTRRAVADVQAWLSKNAQGTDGASCLSTSKECGAAFSVTRVENCFSNGLTSCVAN